MSDSALERHFATRCRQCNIEVKAQYKIPHYRYIWDFAIPECRLLIEINGGTWIKSGHTTGKGLQRDYDKGNAAAINSWYTLTFSSDDVLTDKAIFMLQEFLKLHPPF